MRRTWAITLIAMAGLVLAPAARAGDTEDLYEKKCKMCHGADGKGDTAAGKKLGAHDFHAPDVVKMTDLQIIEIITKGKNRMTAYGGKLTTEQIKALAGYVKEMGKK